MFFPCPAIYRSVDKKQACKRNETSLSIEVDGLWRKGTTKREPARVRTLHFTGCPRMSEMLNTFPHQKSRDQIYIYTYIYSVNLPKTQCRVWFFHFVYLYQMYLYHIISWIKPLNIFPWCEIHSQLLRYLEGHYKSHMIWSYLHHFDDMFVIFHLLFWEKNNVYITVCIHINILPTNVASQMSYLDLSSASWYAISQASTSLQGWSHGTGPLKLIPLEAEHGGTPGKGARVPVWKCVILKFYSPENSHFEPNDGGGRFSMIFLFEHLFFFR